MSTVTSKSYVVAVDQQDKSRRLLRIILILVGVIIFVAAIFLAIVIYRTLKTGAVAVVFVSSQPSPVVNFCRRAEEGFRNARE